MDPRNAALVLAGLGHGLRLALWRLLVHCGPSGMSAGLIAARLSVPPSSLTFHLQLMTQSGLLLQRRSSRKMIYTADTKVLKQLLCFLAAEGRSGPPTSRNTFIRANQRDH